MGSLVASAEHEWLVQFGPEHRCDDEAHEVGSKEHARKLTRP